MRHNACGLFMAAVFLITPFSSAESLPVMATSMPEKGALAFMDEALRNNPRLKAARYRYEAAQARVAFLRDVPDPMLEYEHDRITPSGSMAEGEKIRPMKSLAVSQEIPFPTKIFMRKKSAQKEALVLEQEYKQVAQSVRKDVKEAYARLFLNRQKVLLMQDSLSLMQQFAAVINKKYAANKAGQQDVLRAQVEYFKLSNMVILYEQEEKIAKYFLQSLLGRQDDAPIDIVDAGLAQDMPLTEDEAVALAKKHRPELMSAKAMLEKAVVEESLSRQELLPDISLKYRREERDGSYRDGEWSGMIGINVPIWFWGKQISRAKEARTKLEAVRADYQSAENTAVFEAKSAFAKHEAMRRLVEIYETGVLPQATSTVTIARRAYESGALSFSELLDSLRMLRDLQMEYFESVVELQISLADLELVAGGDLGK